MRVVGRMGIAALLAVASLTFAGCDQLFQRDTKGQVEAAGKKVLTGDFRGAIKLYEAALDGTAKTADVHYRLALLYDDKLRSPLDALHHMDRYLELAPKGSYAKEATAYKKEGELKLLNSLSGGKLLTQEVAVRLTNENLRLQSRINELQNRKLAPVSPVGTTAAHGEQKQKPIPAGAKTHVVKSGETLGSIAQLYYRNKARWKDLQDANFYSLEGTAKIKPGQVLIIPQK